MWALVFGAIQAASPLAFWWLPPATVQALLLCLIAAVYIGFAVADGRPRVIAVESVVAGVFVVVAAAGVMATVWLLVAGYAGMILLQFDALLARPGWRAGYVDRCWLVAALAGSTACWCSAMRSAR
jgi:hypothetical protein